MGRESELETKLTQYCQEIGALTYKFRSVGIRGVPDRVIIYRGKVMFIELKAPGKKPSPQQYYHLRRIKAQGVIAEWADNIQRIKEIIRQ